MICIPFIKLSRYSLGLFLLLVFSLRAMAQPLDDVMLEYQEQGVVATIRLTGPVQYLRHFPSSHGKTLEIFYHRVLDATNNETWVDNEVRRSPPSRLIPDFTVTTRDQRTNPKLVIEFTREAEYSVTPGKDNRSLLITIMPDKHSVATGPLPFLPVIKQKQMPVSTATLPDEEATLVEIGVQAHALMVQGRDALSIKNNESAVDYFNKLLLLPPNDYTQDAQEWVGVSRERNGQIDKARIEYDLYLRLYPEGNGAARVAQRLAGLAGRSSADILVTASTGEKNQAPRWMTFGSVSSRYYHGVSLIDSSFLFNNSQTTSTQSLVDQSMLITSVDASERYVSEEYDGRLVFRDVNTRNFLHNQPSRNRINAAYGEIKSRRNNYMVRAGRQSPSGSGVMGRFDGLSGYFGDSQYVRFNAVAGALDDYSQDVNKPEFVGAGIDKDPFSLYAISQRVDGIMDRRAVGTELRYFEGSNTVFASLDYDTYFKALNAAQVMGTTSAFGGTVNFMVDRRKSPSLSIRNALNGAGTSSIRELLKQPNTTESSLRDLAINRTATTNMGQVGLTLPLRDKWQMGGDIRMTYTTGLQASGTTMLEGILADTPSRGTENALTVQIIGSSLYKAGDIWSGSVTFNTSSAVNGYSVNFYNHTLYASNWTMDTSLQLSHQEDQFSGTTKRSSPLVRGAYRIKEQLYFDLDVGGEFIAYSGPLQTTETSRYFYSTGLRWDF